MAIPVLTELPPSVSLREVEEGDASFLFDLYLETSGGTFASLDLPAGKLRELLEMQFRAREAGWRGQHPDGVYFIISFDSNPAGYLALDEMEGEIALIYLGLRKKFQGRGIASALLRNLQNEAARKPHKICLHVEFGNSALAFWEHHEFKTLQDLGPYRRMEWCPK